MNAIGLRRFALTLIPALLVADMALAQTDAACAAADQAVTARLKPLIDRTDLRSSAIASASLQDLTWARLDCREGRRERAMAMYKRLTEALDRFPTNQARAADAAPAGAADR
jgi:hypothetical protein